MINAQEALQLGLVNHVVPLDALMNKCLELAEKIKKQAPLAIAGIINCVNDYYSNKNGFETEINTFGFCFTTDDSKEGSSAFLEKRAAVFTGK